MRIGIDCRMYGSRFTGIGRYAYELVQHLAKLDAVNEYVCFLNPEEYKTFKKPAKNVRAVRVDAPHYSIAEQTSFLLALWKEKCDLVHFTHFNAPLLYTGKSVVTVHDLTLSKFPGRKMVNPIHRAAYNTVIRRSVSHASHIVTVSQNTKKDLLKMLGTAPKKVTTIYNGMSGDFHPAKNLAATHAAITKKYDIHGDYLLYTGVWRDHKNILGMLRALAQLRHEKKFGGKLVITGRPDAVYAPDIHKTIEEAGLRHAVIFAGLVPEDDLIALYQAARVFVFPSFYEGFGLPLLESMAAGVPVAASNASCIPEVGGAGNAAYFNPYDVPEMAQQIYRAWSDEPLRKQLIANGKKHVKGFSWEQMAKETLAIYSQVLEK